jgi:hypothetical protein
MDCRAGLQEKVLLETPHPIKQRTVSLLGGPEALHQLDERIYSWMDQESRRLSETISNAFENTPNIAPYDMETYLKGLCQDVESVQMVFKDYEETIRDGTHSRFASACRGVLLDEAMRPWLLGGVWKPDAVRHFPPNAPNSTPRYDEVTGSSLPSEAPNFAAASPAGTSNPVAPAWKIHAGESALPASDVEKLRTQIREFYRQAYQPERLLELFQYHLARAAENVGDMAKKMGTRLAQEVASKESPLHRRLNDAEKKAQEMQPETIVKWWQELKQSRFDSLAPT